VIDREARNNQSIPSACWSEATITTRVELVEASWRNSPTLRGTYCPQCANKIMELMRPANAGEGELNK
jgi:hypothetical protein